MSHSPGRPGLIVLAALAALILALTPAAAEPLRVGKAQPQAFSFVPLDVGIEKGMFKKYGLDIEGIGFAGGARLHQGMAAGAIDIALGSGPDLPFVLKGAPELAVAALAGPPLLLGIIVPYDGPVKSADDLKGKKIGVSSLSSVTGWLALELARAKGWGPGGVTPVAIGGSFESNVAAMKTGQVDAFIEASALGLQLAQKKEGRLLMPTADYVRDFHIHVIFASNMLIREQPDTIKRFLKGWFESVSFMRQNKAEAVRIARRITGFDEAIEAQEYDLVMPMFSADGKFDQKALSTLGRSFVELGLLETQPNMSTLYTERFLPGS
jgi:ABC-type nitrate/sulfonate/bicarbonate transport system substrate-binding protein